MISALRLFRTWLCLILFVVILPIAPPITTTAAPASPALPTVQDRFQTTPASIETTIPLGQRQTIALAITNTSDIELTPRLYEAHALPAAGAVPRQVLPESLRYVPLPVQASRIDPQISRDLELASGDEIEFLVFLDAQPDLSAAYTIADWSARGQYVYDTLHDFAERSQQDLRAWMDQQEISYRPFWIANALAVRGTQADVQALAGRAEVALLRANRLTMLEALQPAMQPEISGSLAPSFAPASCNPDENGICWNIAQIGANRVWQDFGVSGQGITVANIDSGVTYDHPALVEQYRGYQASNSFQHNYNWFDPDHLSNVPDDFGYHGTHTMGTMVARGDGSDTQPAVGVAPGSSWISARGCQTTFCSDINLMASAQWLLAPTDLEEENPRPDLRPHIVNNSWADSIGGNQQYAGYTTAWRAAGIFPVFAAGNGENRQCGTVASPGDYAHVVGVGATNQNDLIASFSSIGPSIEGQLKPDISAPGQSIASTFSGEGLSYGTLQGTSMAAPHVVGAVALLWSANPYLIGDYEATYAILAETAVPRTDSRFATTQFASCDAAMAPNNVYGYGRLDAYAAVARATVDVDWLDIPASAATVAPGSTTSVMINVNAGGVSEPGNYQARILLSTGDLSQTPLAVEVNLTVTSVDPVTVVQGIVRDMVSGVPLSATIRVTQGPTQTVAADGSFRLLLPSRDQPYIVTVQAAGYVSKRIEIMPQAGATLEQDFLLARDLAQIQVTTTALNATVDFGETVDLPLPVANVGTQPLEYTIDVPPAPYGVWRSDELQGASLSWIEQPASSTVLSLQDDTSSSALPLGFDFFLNGKIYNNVYVSANGIVSFTPLPSVQSFRNACFPIPETFMTAVVPLRMDLDPSQGGSVSYAETSEGFVITFNDVPLHNQIENRFTFQVVLARNGRMFFNYKQLGSIPRNASVGIQLNSSTAQEIGCGADIPLASGLTLELRPQPDAQLWLETFETAATLAPGQQKDVIVHVGWLSAIIGQPYRGYVRIRTNDPYQPVVSVRVDMFSTPAPYQRWFPQVFN